MRNNSLRQQMIWNDRHKKCLEKQINLTNVNNFIHSSIVNNDIADNSASQQYSEVRWLERIVGDLKDYKQGKKYSEATSIINESVVINNEVNAEKKKQKCKVIENTIQTKLGQNKMYKKQIKFKVILDIQNQTSSFGKNKIVSQHKYKANQIKDKRSNHKQDKSKKISIKQPEKKKSQILKTKFASSNQKQQFLKIDFERQLEKQTQHQLIDQSKLINQSISYNKNNDTIIYQRDKSIGKILKNIEKINDINQKIKQSQQTIVTIPSTMMKNQAIQTDFQQITQNLVVQLVNNKSNQIDKHSYKTQILKKDIIMKSASKQIRQSNKKCQTPRKEKYKNSHKNSKNKKQSNCNRFSKSPQNKQTKCLMNSQKYKNYSQNVKNIQFQEQCFKNVQQNSTINQFQLNLTENNFKIEHIQKNINKDNNQTAINDKFHQQLLINNNMNQKLFTLNSSNSDKNISSQINQTQENKFINSKFLRQKDINQKLNSSLLNQSHQQSNFDLIKNQRRFMKTVVGKKDSQFLNSSKLKQRTFETQLTEPLAFLFQFLDQQKTGILTDTNCSIQNLTEELKMLLSVIFNQIRTKKRFYNFQHFMQQSREVLKVKDQIYSKTTFNNSENIITRILKENIQIIKKQTPLLIYQPDSEKQLNHMIHAANRNKNDKNTSKFICNDKFRLTTIDKKPFSQFKQNSSINYEKSEVIPGINYEEPELFLEKKYRIHQSLNKASISNKQSISISERTKDYLSRCRKAQNFELFLY